MYRRRKNGPNVCIKTYVVIMNIKPMIENLMGSHKNKYHIMDSANTLWTVYDNESFRIIVSLDKKYSVVFHKPTNSVYKNVSLAHSMLLSRQHQEASCSDQAQ